MLRPARLASPPQVAPHSDSSDLHNGKCDSKQQSAPPPLNWRRIAILCVALYACTFLAVYLFLVSPPWPRVSTLGAVVGAFLSWLRGQPSLCALIIEERANAFFIPSILNKLALLGDDVPVYVMHSTFNEAWLRRQPALRRYIASKRIHLLNIDVLRARETWDADRVAVGQHALRPMEGTRRTMNTMMLSTWFWELFAEEFVFVFQSDAMMCSSTHRSVYDFVRFDYVGAPWLGDSPDKPAPCGNGGFSLRKRSTMKQCIAMAKDLCGKRPDEEDESTTRGTMHVSSEYHARMCLGPEDLFFAYCVALLHPDRAPKPTDCATFAFENILSLQMLHTVAAMRPLGVHDFDAFTWLYVQDFGLMYRYNRTAYSLDRLADGAASSLVLTCPEALMVLREIKARNAPAVDFVPSYP